MKEKEMNLIGYEEASGRETGQEVPKLQGNIFTRACTHCVRCMGKYANEPKCMYRYIHRCSLKRLLLVARPKTRWLPFPAREAEKRCHMLDVCVSGTGTGPFAHIRCPLESRPGPQRMPCGSERRPARSGAISPKAAEAGLKPALSASQVPAHFSTPVASKRCQRWNYFPEESYLEFLRGDKGSTPLTVQGGSWPVTFRSPPVAMTTPSR